MVIILYSFNRHIDGYNTVFIVSGMSLSLNLEQKWLVQIVTLSQFERTIIIDRASYP